jgi:cyclophilin family peptidyl-prolyl cis-trans isomerase
LQDWSPNGYDRAVELFERHFYDGSHFFRVVPRFLVQFGISYSTDKELQALARKSIPDDPKKEDPPIKFERGTISYAGSGPNSRGSQLFISYGNSASLGTQLWETPIGKVVEGMEHVEEFYSYGDMPPWGNGPVQGEIHGHPEYIEHDFPLTDKFIHCRVTRSGSEAQATVESPRILRKEDHISDEEEFHKQRDEGRELAEEVRLDSRHHEKLTREDVLRATTSGKHDNGSPVVVGAVAVVALVVLALSAFFFRSQRKVSSKTS